MKGRVLITGVTGSGGSYMAEYLAEHCPEASLHGISRWHSATSQQNLSAISGRIEVHECDLNDFSSILGVFKRARPDFIFHLASHANVRAGFDIPLAVLQNNIMGTANLLQAIVAAQIDPRILICSTSEVYGQVDPKHVPITEECPLNPASPYAVSKTAQDLLSQTYFYNHKLKVIRTRMFAYLNPRRRDLFATSFALQVARIERGLQTELLHGNLESTRTIIDVRDAMSAYCAALERGRPGEVYNLGGDKVITVGEFLEILRTLARCPIAARVDKKLLRPTDVTLQIPSTEKFRNETGWRPKYSFEESIAHLLDHCREVVAHEAPIQ